MAEDALGRPINVNDINALKSALISSTQEVKTSQTANTEQINKLNQNISVLTGAEFQNEIKKLSRYVKEIAENCKGLKELKRSARSGKSLDFVGQLNDSLKKQLQPTLNKSTDKVEELGSKLSQASKIMGGAFKTSIQLAIKDLGTATRSVKEFFSYLTGGWITGAKKAGAIFSYLGESLSQFKTFVLAGNTVGQIFEGTFDIFKDIGALGVSGVQRASKLVTDFGSSIGNFASKLTKGAGNFLAQKFSFVGEIFESLKDGLKVIPAMAKFIGGNKYFAVFGKAFKDMFSLFKDSRAAKNLEKTAQAVEEIPGIGEPYNGKRKRGRKGGGNGSDLCKCICECLKKYLEEMVKLKSQEKNEQKSLWERLFGKKENRDDFFRHRTTIGDKVRGAGSALSQIIHGDKSIDMLLHDAANGAAKLAGKIPEIATSWIPFIGPALGSALGGITESIVSLVLKPLAEEINYLRESSQLMFATTGLGRGTGNESGGNSKSLVVNRLQDYSKGLHTSNKLLEQFGIQLSDIEETGQRISTIEKTKHKFYRMGIQDVKINNNLMKSSFKLSNLIGTDATETADMFGKWHQELGASNSQISTMALGLRDVARTTGLMGENLGRVAKSAESFLKTMRLSGTFTTAAANNIFGLLARGEKTGTVEGTQNLLGVLQQSILGTGGNEQSRLLSLVASGGNENVLSRLRGGTLLEDRGAMRQFAQGLESAMMQFTGGVPINKLGREQKGIISNQLREVYGVGLEELSILIKNLKEQSKSFSERMEDINKAAGKSLNKQQAQTQIEDLQFKTSAEILDKFNQALEKNCGNIEAAFKDISESEKDLGPLLKDIGSDFNGGTEAISNILYKQADIVNRKIKEAGLQDKFGNAEDIANQAIEALRSGDKEGFMAIAAKLKDVESSATEQARRNADPVFKIQAGVQKIEALLRLTLMNGLLELMPQIDTLLQKFENAPTSPKEFAEFIRNLPKESQDVLDELRKRGLGTGIQQVVAGATNGLIQWTPTDLIAAFVQHALPELQKMFREAVTWIDWTTVGEVLGHAVGGVLTILSGPLGIIIQLVNQTIKRWDSIGSILDNLLKEFIEYKNMFLYQFALPVLKKFNVSGVFDNPVKTLENKKSAEVAKEIIRNQEASVKGIGTDARSIADRSDLTKEFYKPILAATNREELEAAFEKAQQRWINDFTKAQSDLEKAINEGDVVSQNIAYTRRNQEEEFLKELARVHKTRILELDIEESNRQYQLRQGAMRPLLPGSNVERDAKKKKAEEANDNKTSMLEDIEKNTGAEAEASKQIVALLEEAVKRLGGKVNIPKTSDVAYSEGPIDTNWFSGNTIGTQNL